MLLHFIPKNILLPQLTVEPQRGILLRSINNKNKDWLLLMNFTVANVKSMEINEGRFYHYTN